MGLIWERGRRAPFSLYLAELLCALLTTRQAFPRIGCNRLLTDRDADVFFFKICVWTSVNSLDYALQPVTDCWHVCIQPRSCKYNRSHGLPCAMHFSSWALYRPLYGMDEPEVTVFDCSFPVVPVLWGNLMGATYDVVWSLFVDLLAMKHVRAHERACSFPGLQAFHLMI